MCAKKILIAPSILSADPSKLNSEIAEIENHAGLIHVDVMDGEFVANKTFPAEVVATLKSSLPLDVHLMVAHPEEKIESYAEAGAAILSIHFESFQNPDEIPAVLEKIRSLGCKAGISINPDTSVEKIIPFTDKVDMVLIMGVFPGKSGQKFMPEVLSKIKKIRELNPDLDIEIDGGITPETAPLAAAAGANILVAGSSVFGKSDRIAAIKEILESAESAQN